MPTISFEDWLQQLKDLGGYYDQNDDGFYQECYAYSCTPQQVADYLNQEVVV